MHVCKFFCLILVHSNTFQAFVMYNLMQQLQCSSIKFCSYNFVWNEVPNNNVTSIINIVLNTAPNSNDAMRIANIVSLTTMGAHQFSVAAIQPSCRKADLPETRDNDTIARKVHVDGNKTLPWEKWRLYTQYFRNLTVAR